MINQEIELIKSLVIMLLCAVTLVMMAALVYALVLCHRVSAKLRRLLKEPEVQRDTTGRPIRERI